MDLGVGVLDQFVKAKGRKAEVNNPVFFCDGLKVQIRESLTPDARIATLTISKASTRNKTLEFDEPLPGWAGKGSFVTLKSTKDELNRIRKENMERLDLCQKD